jgi:ABC-type antimicrobial peptide transport system permease subunit
LLFGVSPTDVPVIATATLVVAVVTTLAAWFPARQVTRINPAIALR